MQHFVTVCVSIILSLFSTTVMSYIAMATPIGPWIAPTLVLFGLLMFKIIPVKNQIKSLSLATAAGSVGGIIGTAFGFSFPTIYFLDQTLFNQWMSSPLFFAAQLTALSLAAGAFGIAIANLLEHRLIEQDNLPFPIGQLVYKTIAATDQIKKAYELMAGFVMTAVFGVLQDGIKGFGGFVPSSFILIPQTTMAFISFPLIRFDIWPMLWAIGFVTGHVIAIPLAVGALAKIILVDPIHTVGFSYLSNVEFVLAFCSGMVLYGAIASFAALPSMITYALSFIKNHAIRLKKPQDQLGVAISRGMYIEWIIISLISIAFFTYFRYSFTNQLFVMAATFGCAYQIAVIAGKIGLAPLGRFATFVMVPAMLFFAIDYTQIVLIATFVEITGGVVADILFGRKMARMANIDRNTILFYQYLGLVVSSLVIGVVFWLLISHFGLGSPELFAYKAQSRQLLIGVKQFDYYPLILGAIFSFLLKFVRVNPMLVLGGLLMPINISLGLIFGGMLTNIVGDRERWEPFWSGVFTANSIWMLFRTILG